MSKKKFATKVLAVALVNINSFVEAQNAVSKMKIRDASAGTILTRSLEFLSNTDYLQAGIDETFLSIGININNEGGYSDFITSLKKRVEGEYVNAGNSDNTKGTITVSKEKSSLGVQGMEATSSWSMVELEQSMLEGGNRVQDLFTGHRTRYATTIDAIGYNGVGGENGILNHTDLNVSTASAVWAGMTNVELTDELSAFIIAQRLGLNMSHWCNVLIVPPALLLKIQTANADDGIDKTIKQKLEDALDVRFVATEHATGTGTAGSDIVVAISTNPRTLSFRIPVPFKMSQVYNTADWKHSFDTMFRIAGVDLLETVHNKLDGF